MKLIQHLPPRLAEIKEIADIQEAIEPELTSIHEQCERLKINTNPLYADLQGVIQWEEWLHITSDPSKTLEQRQLDIVSKLNERLPFTIWQLFNILTGILGEDRFTIETYPGEAKYRVVIDISKRDAGGSIGSLLRRITPAHVWYEVIDEYEADPIKLRAGCAFDETEIIETKITQEKTYIHVNMPFEATEIIEVKNA